MERNADFCMMLTAANHQLDYPLQRRKDGRFREQHILANGGASKAIGQDDVCRLDISNIRSNRHDTEPTDSLLGLDHHQSVSWDGPLLETEQHHIPQREDLHGREGGLGGHVFQYAKLAGIVLGLSSSTVRTPQLPQGCPHQLHVEISCRGVRATTLCEHGNLVIGQGAYPIRGRGSRWRGTRTHHSAQRADTVIPEVGEMPAGAILIRKIKRLLDTPCDFVSPGDHGVGPILTHV